MNFVMQKAGKEKKIYKLQEKMPKCYCLAICSNKELLFHTQGKYSLKKAMADNLNIKIRNLLI